MLHSTSIKRQKKLPGRSREADIGLFRCAGLPSVHDEEGNQLGDEGNDPGDGIGKIQALGRVEFGNLENGINPDNAQSADTEDGDQHGDEGRADAPKRAGGHVHQAA